eukprot:567866-Hanusia_phi.AAC.2
MVEVDESQVGGGEADCVECCGCQRRRASKLSRVLRCFPGCPPAVSSLAASFSSTCLQVVDTSEQSQKAMSSIIEAILSALQQNAMSMNFAFRSPPPLSSQLSPNFSACSLHLPSSSAHPLLSYFDQDNKGKVRVQDFLSGLRALNASMQGNAPLAEEQLEVKLRRGRVGKEKRDGGAEEEKRTWETERTAGAGGVRRQR